MQADSEKLRQAWIKAVQNSIATAFRDKGDDSEVTDTLPVPVTGFSQLIKNSKQSLVLSKSVLCRIRSWTGSRPHRQEAWTRAASPRRGL